MRAPWTFAAAALALGAAIGGCSSILGDFSVKPDNGEDASFPDGSEGPDVFGDDQTDDVTEQTDAPADVGAVDAPTDATADGSASDATTDAPIDAPIDAPTDAPTDGPTGAPVSCDSSHPCASGSPCVDGYCCNSTCTGTCEACDVPGSLGQCTTLTSGQPHGTRTPCIGAGSTCGGTCDGTSPTSCTYATTMCGSASCSSGIETLPVSCSNGVCPQAQQQACAPYVCGPSACLTQCSGDADCADACMVCNGSHQCVTAPAWSPGHSCGATQTCDGTHPTCQACPAPGSASQLHYVDGALGTDDAAHGGGYGHCGYKTITYALTQATGQIALNTYTYSAATNGEQFPLVLNGVQSLTCNYENAGPATIKGAGAYSGESDSIVFHGNGNQLYSCVIDKGNAGAGWCIEVDGLSSGSPQSHSISGSTVTNCTGFAIQVDPAGGGLQVSGSTLSASSGGIFWNSSNGGSLVGNSFSGNTGSDIQCSAADSNLTGNSNTDAAGTGGKPKCTTCGNCPF